MQSDNTAEPIQWDIARHKRSIEEWEGIASRILELLDDTADGAASERPNWRPHAEQINSVVHRFRTLCRKESQRLGFWREDVVAADEAYERVWDEADVLVKWLNRMMQP